MAIKITPVLALCGLLGFLVGCTSTVTRDGVTLTDEEVRGLDSPSELPTLIDERIDNAIDALDRSKGSELIANLQLLVDNKDLSIPHIEEALAGATPRKRGNLVYALGLIPSDRSEEVLVRHLDDEDEIVRFEAAAGLLNQGDMSVLPRLIAYLESEDRAYRYKAIQVLKQVIGRDFGFAFGAPAPQRAEAVARWKAWWKEQRSRLMVRPAHETE